MHGFVVVFAVDVVVVDVVVVEVVVELVSVVVEVKGVDIEELDSVEDGDVVGEKIPLSKMLFLLRLMMNKLSVVL